MAKKLKRKTSILVYNLPEFLLQLVDLIAVVEVLPQRLGFVIFRKAESLPQGDSVINV